MHKLLILIVGTIFSTTGFADTSCINESLKFKDPSSQDISIMKCTLKQMPQVGTAKCLQVAKTLQYQGYADELRIACYESAHKPTIDTCFKAHSEVEDSETADEFAWTCLRAHNLTMTATQCAKFAGKMSSQVQESRVLYYCLNEIKNNSTPKECESLSRRLYPQDSLRDIQSYCRKK